MKRSRRTETLVKRSAPIPDPLIRSIPHPYSSLILSSLLIPSPRRRHLHRRLETADPRLFFPRRPVRRGLGILGLRLRAAVGQASPGRGPGVEAGRTSRPLDAVDHGYMVPGPPRAGDGQLAGGRGHRLRALRGRGHGHRSRRRGPASFGRVGRPLWHVDPNGRDGCRRDDAARRPFRSGELFAGAGASSARSAAGALGRDVAALPAGRIALVGHAEPACPLRSARHGPVFRPLAAAAAEDPPGPLAAPRRAHPRAGIRLSGGGAALLSFLLRV